MTPKEKAKELVDNFTFIDNGEKLQLVTTKDKIKAKQCALIAVDEILEATKISYDRPDYQGVVYDSFWKQVKQEICSM